MGLLDTLVYLFTPYVDAREQAVGTFFRGVTERNDPARIRKRLGALLQHDIAAINLWTEYRYKGYRYLRKPKRHKLYANLQLITDDFAAYYAQHTQDAAALSHIRRLAPNAMLDPGRVALLEAIMDYLSPRHGRYEYRNSSSFGRLLRDPSREKLIGDCNQVVTLYIHLYGCYYDVHDLQIRALPGHVALHYGGVDIETTNGTFRNYADDNDSLLLPIEEIVSINLLDTTDAYFAAHAIAPKDLLQASRFAYVLSHDRELAIHNLEAAYSSIVSRYMKLHNYRQALKFAETSRNAALLDAVGANGALYEIEQRRYAAARRYAQHADNKNALIRTSWQAEGVNAFNDGRYREAIKAFQCSGDSELIQRCFEGLFFEEQHKLGPNPTTESVKRQAGVVKQMLTYAKKSGNKDLIKYANKLQN